MIYTYNFITEADLKRDFLTIFWLENKWHFRNDILKVLVNCQLSEKILNPPKGHPAFEMFLS